MLTQNELRNAFERTNIKEPLEEGWPGLERFAREVERLVNNEPTVHENTSKKPEIGIIPEKLWKELRIFDLISCIDRHRMSNIMSQEIGEIWLDELRRLLNDVLSGAERLY